MGIEVEEPQEPENPVGTEVVFLEAECATSIGENWEINFDEVASNGNYVVVKSGIESKDEAAGTEGIINIPFSVDTTGDFNLFIRLNCPSGDDDSFWLKMDDGNFQMFNQLTTSGWQWKDLGEYGLSKGEHTLALTYREDGAMIDKICITNYTSAPNGKGDEAENICEVENSGVGVKLIESFDGYSLKQNYPNPVNGETSISFEIPKANYVSLKVINILGVEIAELAGQEYPQGTHTVIFNTDSLASGVYFYYIKAGKYSASQKMIIEVK